jgi:tol-pal system protein YbgF
VRLRITLRQAGAAALLAAALLALPARAALFDDEEARKRIAETNAKLTQIQKQLDDRVAALESQVKSQGLVDLLNQVEQLKSDVAKLRGQVEVMTFEVEQSQKRARDLYVDLDTRLRKLEGGPGSPAAGDASPGAAAAASAPPAVATPANEQRAYDAALDQFKAGNYAGAIANFTAFVKAYPKSPLAPSAQYWTGNAQFAQKDFKGAMATQQKLVATWPDSSKVPDALLNIATCQFELSDTAGSRRTLESVVARFPQSDAAAKARQRLAAR